MGEATEELRGQLAQQRQGLSRDLEAIGDRVSPGRMVERRRAAVRQGVGRVRDAVMGAAESATTHASNAVSTIEDKASGVASTAAEAPGAARQHTQGNPMAAGLIAFGAGLLAASVMPATRREQQLAEQVQPALESAASEAGAVAQEVAGDLKEKATEAVHELKESAQDHADTVKAEAHDATSSTTSG